MKTKLTAIALSLCFALSALTLSAEVEAKKKKQKTTAYQKPVKMLIGSIRYKKDKVALKMLAVDQMSKELNASHWAKMSAAEKKEFEKNLGILLQKISFVQARKMFKHIDAILYTDPVVKGNRATIKSTIVVHKAYKKKELVLTWTLLKRGKKWLVLDVWTVGESTIKGLREDQIDPLVKEGGVKKLLQAMRDKMKELG